MTTPINLGVDGHKFDPACISYYRRLQEIKAADVAKNELIMQLILELDELKHQRTEAIEYIRKYEQAQQELDNFRYINGRDAFILFLIDGDGMIFNDALLRKGEDGGKDAARELSISAEYYVHSSINFPPLTFPADLKIVCRVYANVRGLADVCVRAGLVDSPVAFEDFTRGFTRGKTLFDFVDVGPGKDRADEKIQEHFRLHLHDLHCRQIFVGCSHDNGFVRMLEEPAMDASLVRKITLLEGVPFEKEFAPLPFPKTRFGNLFRNAKINATSFYPQHRPDTPQSPDVVTLARTTTNSSATPSMDQPNGPKFAAFAKVPQITWASKAAAALRPPTPPSRPSTRQVYTTTEGYIPRNRKGQRIDPALIPYNKSEVERVKAIKMCNVHYLLKGCPYGKKCTHNHEYNPTQEELETLKFVARMSPCIHGMGCDDPTCIYGHRCPFPERVNKHGRGAADLDDDGKPCIFGRLCKFDREMHRIDLTVVKTMVVR